MENYFIGFMVPPEVQKLIADLTKDVPEPWQSTAPDDLHLTVHYFGHVAEKDLPQLEALTGCIAEDFAPLTLSHGRAIVMRPAKPYMFWAKYAPSTWLAEIADNCNRRMGRLGASRDFQSNRRPTPHLTLARLPHGTYADSLLPPRELPEALTSIRFDTFALWKSERGKYTLIRSWDLKG